MWDCQHSFEGCFDCESFEMSYEFKNESISEKNWDLMWITLDLQVALGGSDILTILWKWNVFLFICVVFFISTMSYRTWGINHSPLSQWFFPVYFVIFDTVVNGFLGGSVVKILPAVRCGFNPWVWKFPWGRKWQPTPVFLPGKSHGQRTWRPAVCGVRRAGHDLATN